MSKSYYDSAIKEIKQGNFQKAINNLNKAIEIEPKNASYFSERGVCYYHLDLKKQALADMDLSVSFEPEYSYRYSSRAYIKDGMGDINGAIADYETAIKLDPDDAVAYNNLGLLQEKLGYMQKSKNNFEKADKLADILENSGIEYNNELKPTNLQKEINEEKKNTSVSKTNIMLDIFRSKETFKEFVRFIRNGFKK